MLHGAYGDLIYTVPATKLATALYDAFDHREEGRAWGLYVTLYPHMHIAPGPGLNPPIKEQTFTEFYNRATMPEKRETAEEIIDRIESKRRR